ncbi:hypothetical protein GGR56DRAFT_463544 [Xylariaceae sp. FL0804]|nr:hypothetical protein GGR56DRAFT_463544 [Xylariaceae sp. FL0804]
MSFGLPAQLPGSLTDREAIADALYRAVLSFDLQDESLLRSAVTEDISAETPAGPAEGIDQVRAMVFDHVSKLRTTHFVTNVRVAVEGPAAARATATVQAQHCPAGDGPAGPESPKFTSGAFYLTELVKVGELWKIKDWKSNFIWFDGDQSVMMPQ